MVPYYFGIVSFFLSLIVDNKFLPLSNEISVGLMITVNEQENNDQESREGKGMQKASVCPTSTIVDVTFFIHAGQNTL